MRLNKFLNETVSAKGLKENEAHKVLASNCNKNRNYKTIFRGDKSFECPNTEPYFFSFPASSRKERKSANTSNHYTLLIDKFLNCWKGWPKRSKGLICSTDEDKAVRYTSGYTYSDILIMVPYDNTPIAVCPAYDIFDSFHVLQKYGLDYMSMLNSMLSYIGIEDTESSIKKGLSLPINDFLDMLNRGAIYAYTAKKLEKDGIREKYKTLKDWLEDVMDPKKNDFKLVTSNNALPPNREVWFDGSAVGYFYGYSEVNPW